MTSQLVEEKKKKASPSGNNRQAKTPKFPGTYCGPPGFGFGPPKEPKAEKKKHS